MKILILTIIEILLHGKRSIKIKRRWKSFKLLLINIFNILSKVSVIKKTHTNSWKMYEMKFMIIYLKVDSKCNEKL